MVSFKEHFSLNNLFSFMRVQCAKPLLFLKKIFFIGIKDQICLYMSVWDQYLKLASVGIDIEMVGIVMIFVLLRLENCFKSFMLRL